MRASKMRWSEEEHVSLKYNNNNNNNNNGAPAVVVSGTSLHKYMYV